MRIAKSIATSVILLGIGSSAFAQSSAPDPATAANGAQTPAQVQAAPAPAPLVPPANTAPSMPYTMQVQDPQQPSLGDIARMARAKKAVDAKTTRILNNENMGQALLAAGRGGAPAISLVGGDGSGASRAGGTGRLTLLDFWATWCGPCRHALPGLKQFVSAYGDQVDVVSISEDHDKAAWSNFVGQNGMSWAQQFDENREMAKRYGVTAFPTYILVDSTGHVVQAFVGDDPSTPLADRLGPEIRNALAGKS